MIFSKDGRECFVTARDNDSKRIQKFYEETNTYHDRNGSTDTTLPDDLMKLLSIKRKPNPRLPPKRLRRNYMFLKHLEEAACFHPEKEILVNPSGLCPRHCISLSKQANDFAIEG